MSKKDLGNIKEMFSELKANFLDYDPAKFVENNLIIEGQQFKLLGNGWKFQTDMYRYIALEATRKTGKPMVICKGRQVGATVMAAALDLYFTNSGLFVNPPIRVAHFFPTNPLVKKFSQTKLEDLIAHSKDNKVNNNKLITVNPNAVDNITMKQFKTGTLWIDSVGLDGDRTRGMTIDAGFFDEVQDMPGLAIENTTKVLTAAKYGPVGRGVQVYFGTPKERSSYFHKLWESSDQRYYYLGCVNCKDIFPFYLSGDPDMWKDIWISGHNIKCPLCGRVQTKIEAIEMGKWVPTRNPDDCRFVGFHINQLYIPYFSRENIESEMPEFNPNKTTRGYHNECLGEFFSGAGLPLTKSEIIENATDLDRGFARKITDNSKNVYLGVDWGGKIENDNVDRGQSFSCVVILSEQPDGRLHVEHAHKLRQHSFEYKKETIFEMYRRFSVRRGVSDWFWGQDVVNDIQMVFKEKFIGAQGSGSLNKPLRYRDEEMMISYNKNLLIEELFDKIRKGMIRFPGKEYDKVDWLIDHCTSMEVKSKVVSNQQVKTYEKGGSPNDGLMALMYAYIAYKFDETKGFTIKPGFTKEVKMPIGTLAYAPKMRI